MKNIRLSGLAFVMLCLYTLPSLGLVLDIRGGILHGAKEVQVGTDLYDVSFREGTCIGLYSGCDEASDFPFSNPTNDGTLGLAANLALLDQVFIDSALGAFDSTPSLTNGCFAAGGCQINTPLFASGVNQVGIQWLFNRNNVNGDIGTGSGGGLRDFDTRIQDPRNDSHVYAVWSESSITPPPPNPVSEPSMLTLLGIGLLGFLRRNSYRI